MFDLSEVKMGAVPFAPGINENVTISSIYADVWKDSKSGIEQPVLKIEFTGPNGESLIHTEFPVNPELVRKQAVVDNRDPEKAVFNEINNQGVRITRILQCFLPVEEIRNIKASSWGEFINMVVAKSGSAYAGVSLRMKVVLNRKDYPSIPKSRSQFITPMEHPANLIQIGRYDRIEPRSAESEPDMAIPDDNNTFEDVPELSSSEPLDLGAPRF